MYIREITKKLPDDSWKARKNEFHESSIPKDLNAVIPFFYDSNNHFSPSLFLYFLEFHHFYDVPVKTV